MYFVFVTQRHIREWLKHNMMPDVNSNVLPEFVLQWMEQSNYIKDDTGKSYAHCHIGTTISIDPIIVFLALITDPPPSPLLSGPNSITSASSLPKFVAELIDKRDLTDTQDAVGADAAATPQQSHKIEVQYVQDLGGQIFTILSEVFSLRFHETEWDALPAGRFKVRQCPSLLV